MQDYRMCFFTFEVQKCYTNVFTKMYCGVYHSIIILFLQHHKELEKEKEDLRLDVYRLK